MNIIFFGTPEFVIPVIEKIRQQHEVVAIVTTPDQKVGRKQLITPSPVNVYGQEHTIPVMTPQQLNNETIEQLHTYNPDLIVVASYGKIIPKAVLEIPTFGAINIHPSLLPKFRGASPIPATILHGDAVGGVSIIKMDEELDHGPIIIKKEYNLSPTDTTETLLPILFIEGADALLEILDDYIKGNIKPTPQHDDEATFCGRFTKEDAYIDLENLPDKEIIDRMIRAYTPWPIVWTKINLNNQELRIKFFPNNIVQLEGGIKQTVKEFLNGYPETKELLSRIFFSV
jgi:methionyl-tRNA formyltransferase